MSKYPEHNKLKNLPEESQAIYKFLDYLEENNIFLAKYDLEISPSEAFTDDVVRFQEPDNVALEFYGIDLVKLGEENVRMLKELQDKQNKRWKQEGNKKD